LPLFHSKQTSGESGTTDCDEVSWSLPEAGSIVELSARANGDAIFEWKGAPMGQKNSAYEFTIPGQEPFPSAWRVSGALEQPQKQSMGKDSRRDYQGAEAEWADGVDSRTHDHVP
jgi:hypothetical protein